MNNNATTPQRPQPKRRQRHQTISSESPKLHPVQSASNIRPQAPQSQRRTPQQVNRNGAQKLQRQHSVSCCTPTTTGKLTPPQFMRLQKATGGSQNSLFSGSKFLDSPAPETVPLPPSHWFSNAVDLVPSRIRTSPTPSSVSDSLSSASSIESTSSDELLSSGFEQRGFRVNPMQLIAAVSAIV